MKKDGRKGFDSSQAMPRFLQEGHDDYDRYLKLIEALEAVCAWIAANVCVLKSTSEHAKTKNLLVDR